MWPGLGSGGGIGSGELVGGEVAGGNSEAVLGARCVDGGGDGTVVAGEGNGAASRMADAGSCDRDGGLVNVGELHIMALVRQSRHQDAARLLRLKHRTGAGRI